MFMILTNNTTFMKNLRCGYVIFLSGCWQFNFIRKLMETIHLVYQSCMSKIKSVSAGAKKLPF